MVTINISMEADLVNRTWGVINDIILDHREHLEKKEIESGNITLVYPSAMIMFQLVESTFPRFEGFEDGEIPLFTLEYMFRITTSTGLKKIISHWQYNLTAGYALTLYKGQRQTIPYVIVDLHKPPPPVTLTMVTAYIALSRGWGCDTIQLLGDFNDTLFTTHPSEDLRQEDVQLAELTRITKEIWDLKSVSVYNHYSTVVDFNSSGWWKRSENEDGMWACNYYCATEDLWWLQIYFLFGFVFNWHNPYHYRHLEWPCQARW